MMLILSCFHLFSESRSRELVLPRRLLQQSVKHQKEQVGSEQHTVSPLHHSSTSRIFVPVRLAVSVWWTFTAPAPAPPTLSSFRNRRLCNNRAILVCHLSHGLAIAHAQLHGTRMRTSIKSEQLWGLNVLRCRADILGTQH